MINKVVDSADQAVRDIQNGATLVVGRFGLCGIPENLINALGKRRAQTLTCVSNNAGVDDWGLGLLLQTKQRRKMVSSYAGGKDASERQCVWGGLGGWRVRQGTPAE